jgi:hypothetical protein
MNESKLVEGVRGHTAVATEVETPKAADESSQTLNNGSTATNGDAVATEAGAEVNDTKSKDKVKNKSVKSKKKKKKAKGQCKKKHGHPKVVESEKKESDSDDSDSSSSDSDSSESSDSDSDSDSDGSSSSEDEAAKKKKAKKSKAKKKEKKEKEKEKAKKKKKAKKAAKKAKVESSSDSDSDSDSDSESEENSRKSRKKKRSRKVKAARDESVTEDEVKEDAPVEQVAAATDNSNTALQQIISALTQLTTAQPGSAVAQNSSSEGEVADPLAQAGKSRGSAIRSSRGRRLRSGRGRRDREAPPAEDKPADGKAAYKRVDQIWDTNIHDYRLQETAKEQADTFDDYVFHVRRRFDWENKFRNTTVDIKSKQLQAALQEIMKGVRAISLVENEPSIDPNMLFLYLEEMRKFYKKTLKERIKKEKKKKLKKRLQLQREHLKLMVLYLDKDYESTKKTLEPMLKAGNITFELLWALFKPNTIAFTTTYGAADQPRCFKVDQAYKEKSFTRGEYYVVEGRYLEFDGKNFGLGDFEMSVDSFKGPRKITQLSTFPLQYHKNKDEIRKSLIARGKKFVTLAGMNFKHMNGLAFQKKKKQMLKFNINGRVMVDPKTFRRENANYQVSTLVAPEEAEDSDDDSCCGGCDDDEDDEMGDVHSNAGSDIGNSGNVKFKVVFDRDNKAHYVEVGSDEEMDDDLSEMKPEKIDKLDEGESAPVDDLGQKRDFTEEELLIASSVVLGFSFVEKSWFEFSVSGIGEIAWDDGAFDSLVLDPSHKAIVKAQVCSHKFHGGKTIDDIIQGKGKGLVFVLHGPPGVGKTLTAEGIAEFLRCPLYAVSAGDLGTDARIEAELNKIMSIAHSWGAVLLLDEADVFLEKRQHQDVHRNALVSVFLRLLEYFQGILFLTTNRVETFDEAFQSRIHIALKYAELGVKAKREIWRMFLGKVAESGSEIGTFRDTDYDRLAKSNLNGRQVSLYHSSHHLNFHDTNYCYRSRTWSRLPKHLLCMKRLLSTWSTLDVCLM